MIVVSAKKTSLFFSDSLLISGLASFRLPIENKASVCLPAFSKSVGFDFGWLLRALRRRTEDGRTHRFKNREE
jgi:hypothetical protein